MATLRLRPNGNGATTQHSRNGGAANWSRVSEVSADEDVTYNFKVSSGSTFATDLFALENSGGQIGTINGITAMVRGRAAVNTNVAQMTPAIRPAGATVGGSFQSPGGVYVNMTQAWATSPATSAAWTWAGVDALQAGYQSQLDDDGITASETRATQVYVDVDYNEAFDPITVSGLALGDTGDPDFVSSGGGVAPPRDTFNLSAQSARTVMLATVDAEILPLSARSSRTIAAQMQNAGTLALKLVPANSIDGGL